MKLSRKEKQVLKELADEIKEKFGAKRVLLYGSAVRGDMTEESDIDILVILPKCNWEIEKKIIELCFEYSLECERVISVMCYGEHELAESAYKYSVFLKEAIKTGISI